MTEPEIYMTPQLAKRKDGLCPSRLNEEVLKVSTSKGGGPSHAAISKSYQTNTKYLTETVRELENDSEELKLITDSVNKFLKEHVDNSDDFTSISFEPKGCTWKLELDIDKVKAPDYRIQVICMAKASGDKRTTFVVDTTLLGKSDKISSTSLPGFKEAKATFEATSLVVRKAVVRCEFPEFPEGCKGRIFREVYQLNARVSREPDDISRFLRKGKLNQVCSFDSSNQVPLQLFAAVRIAPVGKKLL